VEETQFIPNPAMKVVSPRIIPRAQTAKILRPIAVTVTVIGFDTAAFTGRTPLPGANILVTDNNLTGLTKIPEDTSGVDAIRTFNLNEGQPYLFSAVMTGYRYRPQFSVQYTASSATPQVQLQLMRINPFTTGMLATARPVKIRVLETGYLIAIDDPHPIAGAKVYLTRRVGDRFYGVETTTGADGYIPAYISIPYETDYEVYVFASDFGVLHLTPSPDFPYYIFADPERKIYLKRLLLP
jgi:hypothetical protein